MYEAMWWKCCTFAETKNETMKNRCLFFVIALLACCVLQAQSLTDRLASLPQVSISKKLESKRFSEKYLLNFTQPVDPKDTSRGTFQQRVILCHVGYDRPTVLVTEGYSAYYALYPNYEEELSRLLNANVICVEYRYFADSTPKEVDYAYLTVENSLADLHQITQTFKKIYGGKWISTGISKGGMTTMFYRASYPEDVDISVPYVAPLNKGIRDGRHEKFLKDKVGTARERQLIKDFQMEVLKRRNTLVPLFKKYCDEKKYTFRLPIDNIYDLCIMEYSFALWQWGTPVETIPAPTSDDQTLLQHLLDISEPNYFSEQGDNYSFNVQAVKELGYYGYDMKPFRKYTSMKNSKDYMYKVMLAPSEGNLKFSKALYKATRKYLKKNDPKMIYIYGGIDPWGSSGVGTWLKTDNKENLKVYTWPRGSHSTRIGSFDEQTRKEIMDRLNKWLGE